MTVGKIYFYGSLILKRTLMMKHRLAMIQTESSSRLQPTETSNVLLDPSNLLLIASTELAEDLKSEPQNQMFLLYKTC